MFNMSIRDVCITYMYNNSVCVCVLNLTPCFFGVFLFLFNIMCIKLLQRATHSLFTFKAVLI